MSMKPERKKKGVCGDAVPLSWLEALGLEVPLKVENALVERSEFLEQRW